MYSSKLEVSFHLSQFSHCFERLYAISKTFVEMMNLLRIRPAQIPLNTLIHITHITRIHSPIYKNMTTHGIEKRASQFTRCQLLRCQSNLARSHPLSNSFANFPVFILNLNQWRALLQWAPVVQGRISSVKRIRFRIKSPVTNVFFFFHVLSNGKTKCLFPILQCTSFTSRTNDLATSFSQMQASKLSCKEKHDFY